MLSTLLLLMTPVGLGPPDPVPLSAVLAATATVHPTALAAAILQFNEDVVSREITVVYSEFDGAYEVPTREITVLRTQFSDSNIVTREITVVSQDPFAGQEAITREVAVLSINGPTLTGTINWSGLGDPLLAPERVTMLVSEADSTLIYSLDVAVDSNGQFSIPVPDRAIRLSMQVRPWLRKTLALTQPQLTLPQTLNLVGGDIDGDNEVGIGDYADLSFSYGKAFGDPGFNPYADLDLDGEVAIADYAILSSNYGRIGDEP